jgi:hypothetical protein
VPTPGSAAATEPEKATPTSIAMARMRFTKRTYQRRLAP